MLKRIHILVLILMALAIAPTGAAQRVEFVDGRSMIVESLKLEGSFYLLFMDSSSSMAVPADRVHTVKRYEPASSLPEISVPAPWIEVAGVYRTIIETAAGEHGIDPALVTAMIQIESNFDPYAVSRKGACGLLQLIPATAERFGVKDIFDPEQNVTGGVRYMRWLMDRFDNRTDFALAAYNAGEGVVKRYNGIPPYRETEAYVRKVMNKVELNGGQNPSLMVNGLVR
jgi:soluble lytic murein transglycosylase-like protein